LIGASIAIIVMYPFPTVAMHDSNLGVNTWLASDNSTTALTTGELFEDFEDGVEADELVGEQTALSSGDPDQNENETTTTMTAEAWKTCEDPILQISIECPTNWSMNINEDGLFSNLLMFPMKLSY
jgi:hypothetical protein